MIRDILTVTFVFATDLAIFLSGVAFGRRLKSQRNTEPQSDKEVLERKARMLEGFNNMLNYANRHK